MLHIRKAGDRGHADHGWLKTSHSFSFADYFDPAHTGFRSLRVINEDRVAAGKGFGEHSHRDMEIISYVLEGALEHRDSLGNGQVLRPGEFQRMSAGTGVFHSEFNPSPSEAVHFYQIWLLPRTKGLRPSYEQRFFSAEEKQGRFCIVASPDGRDGSLTIHSDANVYLSTVNRGQSVSHEFATNRFGWLQVLRGSVHLNGKVLDTSDGAAIRDEPNVRLDAQDESELLLFDLG